MIYTIKKVIINPGGSVRQFLTEDRYRFVKPITFLFITSLIYTVACHFFHIDAKNFYLQQLEIEFPTATLLINWMLEYQGYGGIISGFFVAFWIKLFFKKSGYNIFEIFILLCFVSGISALFFTVVLMLQGLTHLGLIYISTFILLIYYAWAIGQFFNRKKMANYIKAFISCILGYFLFGFSVAFIAIFIDLIIKQ